MTALHTGPTFGNMGELTLRIGAAGQQRSVVGVGFAASDE
jgi:hypothetical protein